MQDTRNTVVVATALKVVDEKIDRLEAWRQELCQQVFTNPQNYRLSEFAEIGRA